VISSSEGRKRARQRRDVIATYRESRNHPKRNDDVRRSSVAMFPRERYSNACPLGREASAQMTNVTAPVAS
jgi:hypothetical protein